jgi:hypothetical protein
LHEEIRVRERPRLQHLSNGSGSFFGGVALENNYLIRGSFLEEIGDLPVAFPDEKEYRC